jgi:hypothetical protein
LAIFLAKRYTFYRDQDSRRERHHLGGAARRRVLGEELTVNLVDYAKVIAGDHENGCFDDFAKGTAGFFQDDLNVLKTLSGLIFEIVANNLSGIKIVAGGTGDEDEFFGYDCLGEGLAHSGSLWGVEVFGFQNLRRLNKLVVRAQLSH